MTNMTYSILKNDNFTIMEKIIYEHLKTNSNIQIKCLSEVIYLSRHQLNYILVSSQRYSIYSRCDDQINLEKINVNTSLEHIWGRKNSLRLRSP